MLQTKLELLQIGLTAKDYRSLLAQTIRLRQAQNKIAYSFSALSHRAGFKSRSFISEVLAGKKNMSLVSLQKLCEALSLKSSIKQLTQLLLLKELASSEPNPALELKIQGLKKKIQSEYQRMAFQNQSDQSLKDNPFGFPELMYIYAALGEHHLGASIEEIVSKTGLSPDVCVRNLEFLQEHQFIERKERRYFANLSHLVLNQLGQSMDFKKIYLRSLCSLQKNADKNFNSTTDLFFHSAFSISQKNLPLLKNKLRELIIDFVDEHEDDDGIKIAKLTVGLYFN